MSKSSIVEKPSELELSFAANIAQVIADTAAMFSDQVLIDAFGAHAARKVRIAFAFGPNWRHFAVVECRSGDLILVLLQAQPCKKNINLMLFVPAHLESEEGHQVLRRNQRNTFAVHLIVLDFDKGDADLNSLQARLDELDMGVPISQRRHHYHGHSPRLWQNRNAGIQGGASSHRGRGSRCHACQGF